MTRFQFALCILTCTLVAEVAAEDAVLPVYQRSREVSLAHVGYDGGIGGWRGGYSYGVPYAYPWFTQQFFAGTWYQRPYPYHFDYHRWRDSRPPVACGLGEPDPSASGP